MHSGPFERREALPIALAPVETAAERVAMDHTEQQLTEMAVLDFEPWDKGVKVTADHWQGRLQTVNIALHVMGLSREELIGRVHTDEACETLVELAGQLHDFADDLRNLASAVEGASGRLLMRFQPSQRHGKA